MILGLYRHYKGGVYRVLGTFRHTETDESFVAYEDIDDTAKKWVRPESMFHESVVVEGTAVPRFMPVSEKLVRDAIPDIIRREGKEPLTRVVNGAEYSRALDEKLSEEIRELRAAPTDTGEYADVIEVLRTMARINGVDWNTVETKREEKRATR